MFKKLMVSLVSAAVIMSGMPVEAASFGSRTTSSRSSSSFSRPSAPSSSSFSRSTPSSATTSTNSTGSLSSSGAMGRQNSASTNNVRNGTAVAASNESTIAGKNPSGSTGTTGTTYGGNRYGSNYGSSTYATPVQQGHSTGALLGAAAAGAVGGYMLNGIMHNRDGSNMNGYGYNNGVPQGNMVDNSGQGYQQGNNMGYNNGGAPVVINKGYSIWWSILGFLLVLIVCYIIYQFLFGSKKNSNEGVSMFNNKSPEAQLREMMETFFINFQKNNKPSGLDYIRANTTPSMFEAVSDVVGDSSDTRTIRVKNIEAKLLNDVAEVGSGSYQATVEYIAELVEQEVGQEPATTKVHDTWQFDYTPSSGWKLAGLTPV